LLETAAKLRQGRKKAEGPTPPKKPAQFQQLAAIYASSCHPLLEFDGFARTDVGV
jgi:hypothetical protein